VKRLIAVAMWLCVGCAITGLFGRISPAADFVNQLTILWLPAGLIAAAVTARHFRSRAIAAFAIFMLYASVMIAPELLAHRIVHNGQAAWGDLKLLQFNLFKGNVAPEATANWIAAQAPDVITISEGDRRALEILRRLKPLYPYQVSCLEVNFCSTWIASKSPPLAIRHLGTGDPENSQGLSAVEAIFDHDGTPFAVISVHLMRPWPYHDQTRAITALQAAVALAGPERTIVAGDFNTPESTFAMRRLDHAIGLRRITHGLPTWPALLPTDIRWPFPLLGIDHIYVGKGWQVASVTTGPGNGSDHRPVTAVLGLVNPSVSGPPAIARMKS
jgi:endonuclease/exonuclease/phosphatase (EEP) superfamily protein YafD